jgi:uncharacterized protein (DUF2267 family)
VAEARGLTILLELVRGLLKIERRRRLQAELVMQLGGHYVQDRGVAHVPVDEDQVLDAVALE